MPSDTSKSKETASTKEPLCFVIGPIGKDGSDERKHSLVFQDRAVSRRR